MPQGRFVNEIGDGMIRALGPERVPWAYRMRSLLDAGCVLPGSSDRPVVAGAPLLGMHDMVNRCTASGAPFSPGRGDHRARGADGVHARLGVRRRPGAPGRAPSTLGKVADLVVLSADPATVAPDAIKDIEVLRTMVGGEWRWTA